MGDIVFDPWTDEQCEQLKPAWELARARRDAHHASYRTYNKYYTIVSLPPILVGAVLSTLSLDPTAVPAGLSASLAIFMTAMSTINSFFNVSKTTEGHRLSYRAFNLLVREIETGILRGKESPKRSFVDFLDHANDQVGKLIEDAPTLSATGRVILENHRANASSPFDDENTDKAREALGESNSALNVSNISTTLSDKNISKDILQGQIPLAQANQMASIISNPALAALSQNNVMPSNNSAFSNAGPNSSFAATLQAQNENLMRSSLNQFAENAQKDMMRSSFKQMQQMQASIPAEAETAQSVLYTDVGVTDTNSNGHNV